MIVDFKDTIAKIDALSASLQAWTAKLNALSARMRDMRPTMGMHTAMAVELAELPKWRRKRKQVLLDTGEICDFTQVRSTLRTVCTPPVSGPYGAGEINLLRQMASAQLEWTFQQVIARKNELRGRK